MGEKSYLKEQVYLPGLSSYDLFTDEEYDAYMQIIEAKNELNKLDGTENDELRRQWVSKKQAARTLLNELIPRHAGTPRTVRLRNIIHHPKDAGYDFPPGVTWRNLKFSKKISEFSSELTRSMGLKHMDYTFDQIVVKWKSLDILKQIVLDGFCLPIMDREGNVQNKHYHFYTSSAGQLRRDKVVMLSDEIWEKIHEQMECGLTWDVINAHEGCNAN